MAFNFNLKGTRRVGPAGAQGKTGQDASCFYTIQSFTVGGCCAAPVLTDATRARWQGFVALICNAYFEKRMASFPIDRLQLELRVAGRMERDDTVAEWSRLVYETLNHVAPQFPKD